MLLQNKYVLCEDCVSYMQAFAVTVSFVRAINHAVYNGNMYLH